MLKPLGVSYCLFDLDFETTGCFPVVGFLLLVILCNPFVFGGLFVHDMCGACPTLSSDYFEFMIIIILCVYESICQ